MQKDNERAFAARNKIVELEAKIVELTAKVEDAQAEKAAKQQIQVELVDVKVQLSSKDKDLQAKDVEIAELKKPLKKKKIVNLDPEVTSKGAGSSRATAAAGKGTLRLRQSDLNDYVMISDSLKGLSRTAETKTGAGGSRSSGSAGSRNPDAGATPSTAAHEEEEAEEEEDAAAQLVSRKRVRSETTAGVAFAPMVGPIPLVRKTSNLRSLYKFSHEIKKKTPEKGVKFTEPEPKRPKITIKSSQTAGVESTKEKNVAEKDAAKATEAQRKVEERRKKIEEEKKRKAEEDRKSEEAKKKKAEEEKRAEEAKRKRASDLEREREQKKAMEKSVNDPDFETTKGPERRTEPEVVKPTHPAHAEAHDRTKIVSTKGSGRYVSSGASSGGAGGYNPQVIGAKDTVGDIYYKSYTEEERGSAPHQAPWSLKQRDTFQEFGPCTIGS
ncbi:hepatoma-derived growth factor-related protein 2-like [Helianthus annuus]|uniref:hepatoma-derived growth factor-related protein 2-like n=1 Tax=Helianthus annuus TaxID=4232 RepID=UPI000B8FF84B|nr:hepatoma-derived growth factor-related protein 2-like [Helianthus annuus]